MGNKVRFSYFKKIFLLKILFLLFFNATVFASNEPNRQKRSVVDFVKQSKYTKKLIGLVGLTGFGSLLYLLLSKKSAEGGDFEQINEVLSSQVPLNDLVLSNQIPVKDLMKILSENMDFHVFERDDIVNENKDSTENFNDFQKSNQNNIVILNEDGRGIDQFLKNPNIVDEIQIVIDKDEGHLKTNNRDQDIINSILKKEDFHGMVDDHSKRNRFIEILNQSDNKLIPYYYCDDESLLYSNNNTPQTCLYITKEILQKLLGCGILDDRSCFFSNISFVKANHPEEALNIVLKMILKRKKRIEIVNQFMDSNKFDLIQGKINICDNSNVFKYQIIERLCKLFFNDEELIQEVDIFYDLFKLFDEHCKGENIKDSFDKFEDCAGNILLPFLRYLVETHDDIMEIGSLKQKSDSLIVKIEIIKYLSEAIKQSYLEFVCHALSEAIRDNDVENIKKNKHCFEFFLTHYELTCDFKKCKFDILLVNLIRSPEQLNLFLKHIETKIIENEAKIAEAKIAKAENANKDTNEKVDENAGWDILLQVLTKKYFENSQDGILWLCDIRWSSEKNDYVLLLPSAYVKKENESEYDFLIYYFEKYVKHTFLTQKINPEIIKAIENPDEFAWLFHYIEKNYPHKLIDLFFTETIDNGQKVLEFNYKTKVIDKNLADLIAKYGKSYREIFNTPDKNSKEYLDTIAFDIQFPLFLKLPPEEITVFLKNCCVIWGESLLHRENNIILTLLNFTSVDHDVIIFMQDFCKKMIDDNIAEIAFLVSQKKNFSFNPLLSGKEGTDRLTLCNTLNQLKNLDKNDKNAAIEKQIFDYKTIFLVQYDNFIDWFDSTIIACGEYNTDEEIASYKRVVSYIMNRYAELGGNKEKLLQHIKIFYDGEHTYATLQEKNNKNTLKVLCFLSNHLYFSDTDDLFNLYKEVIQKLHFKDFLVIKKAILQGTNDKRMKFLLEKIPDKAKETLKEFSRDQSILQNTVEPEFELFLKKDEIKRLEIILSDLIQCAESTLPLVDSKKIDIKTALTEYHLQLIEGCCSEICVFEDDQDGNAFIILNLSKKLVGILADAPNTNELSEINKKEFFELIVENFKTRIANKTFPFDDLIRTIPFKQNIVELLLIGTSSDWIKNNPDSLLVHNLITSVNESSMRLEVADLKRLSETMLCKDFYLSFIKFLNDSYWVKTDDFKTLDQDLLGDYLEIIADCMWYFFKNESKAISLESFFDGMHIDLKMLFLNSAFIRYKNQNYSDNNIKNLYWNVLGFYDFNINEFSIDFINYIINRPQLLKFFLERAEKIHGGENDFMDFVDNKIFPILSEKKLDNDSEYDFLKPYSLVKDCCKILTDYREKQRENGNQIFPFEDPKFPVEYLSKNLSLQLLLAMERREIQAVCQYQTKQIHKKLSDRGIWSFFKADGRKSNNEQLKSIFARLYDDCSLELYLNFAFGRKCGKFLQYQESFIDIGLKNLKLAERSKEIMINKFKNFKIRMYQDTDRASEEIEITGIQNLSELHRKQLIQYHKIWYPNNDKVIAENPFKKDKEKQFEFFSFFAELLLSFTKDTDDSYKKLRLLLPGFKNFYFKDTQALFHIAGYSFSECNAAYKKGQFYIKESKEAIIKNSNLFWFVDHLKQSAKPYNLPKKIINKATLFALLQHKIMPCYSDVENCENSCKKEFPLQKKIFKKLPVTLLSIIEEEPIDIISLYPLKAKKINAMVAHYDDNQKIEFNNKLLNARTKIERTLSENQFDLITTQNTEKNIDAINGYLG